MKTTICDKCDTAIRNCNFKKHIDSCNGEYKPFVKSTMCRHCGINLDSVECRPGHVRWCSLNPKRPEYVKAMDCSQMHTASANKKRQVSLVKTHAAGAYDNVDFNNSGWKQTEESKELIRQKALASPHRRLVRSIRDYVKKDGSVVRLDSSWEEALATRLDELDIEWTRPPPVKWLDEDNVYHNYFPDFYLPNYDVYLDPKSPYAIKAQESKLKCLTIQLKNLVIIKTLEDCKNFIP